MLMAVSKLTLPGDPAPENYTHKRMSVCVFI
jgi:hypothetical protein